MAQLTGSGPGHGANYAIVNDVGRLWTNDVLDGVKIRGSGLVVYDKPYDRLVSGKMFQAGSYIADLADGGSVGILIAVGSESLHLDLDARTDGDAVLEFFEDVAISNSGTSLPIYNVNRTSTNTMNSTLWINPTVTTSGNMLYSALFLGGSGVSTKFVSPNMSIAPEALDWLLCAGSAYWIKFTNKAYRGINLDYNFYMHEHN